jgi:hypothetical protein
MRDFRPRQVALLCAFIALLVGCGDDDLYMPVVPTTPINTPAVKQVADSLAFTITADTCTAVFTYIVPFTAQALTMSVSSLDHSTGYVITTLSNKWDEVVRTDSLGASLIQFSEPTYCERPRKVTFRFNNFSGRFSYAIRRNTKQESVSLLLGTWDWIFTFGGVYGMSTPATRGYEMHYVFTQGPSGALVYSLFRKDTLYQVGALAIDGDTLSFELGISPWYWNFRTRDTLALETVMGEHFSSEYARRH